MREQEKVRNRLIAVAPTSVPHRPAMASRACFFSSENFCFCPFMKNPFWYLDGISVGGCSVIRCHLVFLHVLIVIPLEQVGAAAADHVEKQERSIHADTDNYADGTARQTGFCRAAHASCAAA